MRIRVKSEGTGEVFPVRTSDLNEFQLLAAIKVCRSPGGNYDSILFGSALEEELLGRGLSSEEILKGVENVVLPDEVEKDE